MCYTQRPQSTILALQLVQLWRRPTTSNACLQHCVFTVRKTSYEWQAPHPPSGPHGVHDASDQLDTVARWWQLVPHANVGIRTGSESRLVVLDVDGPPGRQALRALVAAHGLFQASWARTGSGGWHAYFAHPGGTVPSSAGRLGSASNVRGEGGYVVAPPSRHWTGRRYRWIVLPDGSAPFHRPPRHPGRQASPPTGPPLPARIGISPGPCPQPRALPIPGRRGSCFNQPESNRPVLDEQPPGRRFRTGVLPGWGIGLEQRNSPTRKAPVSGFSATPPQRLLTLPGQTCACGLAASVTAFRRRPWDAHVYRSKAQFSDPS
jgi:bifunctional DNA primase/polymerase-like protein